MLPCLQRLQIMKLQKLVILETMSNQYKFQLPTLCCYWLFNIHFPRWTSFTYFFNSLLLSTLFCYFTSSYAWRIIVIVGKIDLAILIIFTTWTSVNTKELSIEHLLPVSEPVWMCVSVEPERRSEHYSHLVHKSSCVTVPYLMNMNIEARKIK